MRSQIRLDIPLPWNVRDAQGQLLLRKGYDLESGEQLQALMERGVYVDVDEFRQAPPQPRETRQRFDPFSHWLGIRRSCYTLLTDCGKDPEFAAKLQQVVKLLVTASQQDVDVGIFEMLQLDMSRYPINHSLRAAFLASLVTRRMGWNESEQKCLGGAALTMNLAMLDLQAVLSKQTKPPNDDQCKAIRLHPQEGRRMLEEAKVTDGDWLRAVEQHHELPSGRGYPFGKPPSEMAYMLHHIDVYLAKLAPRATRRSMLANRAARDFLLSKGGATNEIAASIIKEFGIYPPGTYVKLENGETAIVVRRGEQANAPLAFSLSNGEGLPYVEPVRRETHRKNFSIVDIIPPEKVMVRINRHKLFGYSQS